MAVTAPEAPLASETPPAPPPDRLPPRNVFGLERGLVGPALAIAGVVAFFSLFIPWLDSQVSDDPAGTDPIAVGYGVRATPPDGWDLDADDTSLGTDQSEGRLAIARSGVLLDVHAAEFDGSDRDLLERELDQGEHLEGISLEGSVTAATTDDGVAGVAQNVNGAGRQGRMYAFVHEGVGVVVTAFGPDTSFNQHLQEVSDVAASLRFTLDGRPRS